jgi:hypothetical protein
MSLALLGLRHWRARGAAAAQRLYDRLTDPALEQAATGALAGSVAHTLLAVTEALVDTPIEPSHYAEYFRWRARNLDGYKSLYEKLAARLDQSASRSGHANFADCDAPTRRRILSAALVAGKGKHTRLLHGIVDQDALRFEKYVAGEILELFQRTDSWTRLGYEAWPGTARGLDHYTRAPERAL